MVEEILIDEATKNSSKKNSFLHPFEKIRRIFPRHLTRIDVAFVLTDYVKAAEPNRHDDDRLVEVECTTHIRM